MTGRLGTPKQTFCLQFVTFDVIENRKNSKQGHELILY